MFDDIVDRMLQRGFTRVRCEELIEHGNRKIYVTVYDGDVLLGASAECGAFRSRANALGELRERILREWVGPSHLGKSDASTAK